MARCSFGKVVLNGVFAPRYPFGTDLEGRMLYLEDGQRRWLLAAFDFSGTFRSTARAWREAVSRETGIPVENVWYHELQIHAAPISFELAGEPGERLVELCLPEIRAMIARAEEAELSYVLADFGGKFSMNREQYIPELGAVTVWAGLEFDEGGRPFGRDPAIMNLGGYRPALPAFDGPVPFDRPTDPQGMLAVFRTKEGKVLGSLARFAAHPDVAVLFESQGITDQYRYHFDWPGYLRREIDEQLGGIGLYLNGPCADLSVKKGYAGMTTYEACDREALRIGRQIAGALLEAWRHRLEHWEPVKMGCPAADAVPLPMREDMPGSRAAARDMGPAVARAKAELAAAVAGGAAPARVKRLIDVKLHLRAIGGIVGEWCGFTDGELTAREVPVEVEAVALNGLVFLGLPGECLSETVTRLRAGSLGEKLIALDQVNGYLGYLTTARAYDEGGYSYWGGWLRRDGEALLRGRALEMVRRAARQAADPAPDVPSGK